MFEMRINREMSKVDETGMICAFVPAVDQVDEFHLDCLAPGKCQKIIGFQKFTRIGASGHRYWRSRSGYVYHVYFFASQASLKRGGGVGSMSPILCPQTRFPHMRRFFFLCWSVFSRHQLCRGAPKHPRKGPCETTQGFLGKLLNFSILSRVLCCHVSGRAYLKPKTCISTSKPDHFSR